MTLAEGFSDVATPVNTYVNTGFCTKDSSYSNTTTPRPWLLVADSKMWYLTIYRSASATFNDGGTFCHGDFLSVRAGDAWNCFSQIGSATPSSSVGSYFCACNTGNAKYISRAYHQGPGSIQPFMYGHRLSDSLGYGLSLAYPNPANNGLIIHDNVELYDSSGGSLRGYLPGIKTFPQSLTGTFTNPYIILDNIPGRSGEIYLPGATCLQLGNTAVAWPTYNLGNWR